MLPGDQESRDITSGSPRPSSRLVGIVGARKKKAVRDT
jgi:hypothetical protein